MILLFHALPEGADVGIFHFCNWHENKGPYLLLMPHSGRIFPKDEFLHTVKDKISSVL